MQQCSWVNTSTENVDIQNRWRCMQKNGVYIYIYRECISIYMLAFFPLCNKTNAVKIIKAARSNAECVAGPVSIKTVQQCCWGWWTRQPPCTVLGQSWPEPAPHSSRRRYGRSSGTCPQLSNCRHSIHHQREFKIQQQTHIHSCTYALVHE